ncbi:hypothetical protein [Motilimonas pumila]|uniref:Uncharacterized protein n=1 Tax=Motilimonas pumila TaxID=2303987 RepID=A0A418Y988_9GAMM|nr:hypothetical protein [Motilimonas pumila]RJG36791.1 hypothetical protein D1Z90_20235 [Motilimonas pumila]
MGEKDSTNTPAIDNRLILREVGINPLLSRENFTWAPNKVVGQHGSIQEQQLNDMLTPFRGDRAGVVDVLEQWAAISKAR